MANSKTEGGAPEGLDPGDSSVSERGRGAKRIGQRAHADGSAASPVNNASRNFERLAVGESIVLENGAPEGTRTPNLLIRSQMLYPVELPAQPKGR